MSAGDGSSARLNRIYGLYTAGLLAFIVLMAILSAIGVPNPIIGYAFFGFTILLYAVIGILGRTMKAADYFVAGQRVPAVYNGMATGAGWMSGASFLGLAGALYISGQDGLALVLGGAGGFVLAAVLIAPYLRKSGAYTIPDFLAARYGGRAVRLAAVIVLLACSFIYAVAQLYAFGILSARFLGIDFSVAVFAGLGITLICTLPGGMRAVTWTQVAQYIVLVIALLIPAIWMQIMQDAVSQDIAALGEAQGILAGNLMPQTPGRYETLNHVLLILCLMTGTASLPHILARSLTTPSVRGARVSLAWALLFVAIVCITGPAYAAFGKWAMLELVQSGLTAGWLIDRAQTDATLVTICGAAAVSVEAVAAACSAQGVTEISFSDIVLDADMIALAAPEMAGMPYVLSALMATGGLAALLASSGALLLAMGNTLGNDFWHAMAHPDAPTTRRLLVSRVMLVLVALAAAWVATTRPADIFTMVSWAFSLAAAGLFPALVLAVWWKRANSAGAAAGIAAGFGISLYYMLATRYGAVDFYETWNWLSSATAEQVSRFTELKANYEAATGEAQTAARAVLDSHARTIANWWGIRNLSSAAFGLPVGFAVMIAVSLLTKAPPKQTQDFVDELRIPRGETPITQPRI